MAITKEKKEKLDKIFGRSKETSMVDIESRISRLRAIAETSKEVPSVEKKEERFLPRREISAIDVAKKTGGFYEDVLRGGLKGAARTVTGIASLPQAGGRALAEKITGKPAPKEFRTVREMAEEKLRPVGQVQRGAMSGEQLAEFFMPSGAIAKLTTGRGLITRMLTEGITFGGITAAQEGEIGKEAKTAAIFGAAIPVVGAGIKLTQKAISTAKNLDDVVGEIIQGKTKDISKAKEALASLDTKGIKTYDQLSGVIGQKIRTLASSLDKSLEAKGGNVLLRNLTTTTKVGEKSVVTNYVDDALNQLDELYSKINDPVMKETLVQVKEKALNKGLTIKDINDLSRQYGSEFGSKAFSKVGDPLTSINAKAYENTRKGLKDLARKLYGREEFKIVDSEMSKLIKVRELTERMTEKVNVMKQKIHKRGLGARASRSLFNTIDTLSGRTISGFTHAAFPRSLGVKVFNALDLEKELQKNLKRLESFEKTKSWVGKILEPTKKRILGE